MKLVTYNIQFGRGRDEIVDLERIAQEVAGADIIALQEVDRYFERSGDADQVTRLNELFPTYHTEFGAGVNIAIDQIGPDGGVLQRRRQFGNMTLSRYPMHYIRHHLLPKYASTGPISIQRSALECIIETPIGPVRIINTHLTHLSSETRLPQVEFLKRVHRDAIYEGAPISGVTSGTYWHLEPALALPPSPTIMMGDFNMEPDSAEYAAVVGPLSDYGGRITNPTLFADAWVVAGHAEALGATADVHGRPARLDYIFISPVMAPLVGECHVDHEATGSDHQPVWLELTERMPQT